MPRLFKSSPDCPISARVSLGTTASISKLVGSWAAFANNLKMICDTRQKNRNLKKISYEAAFLCSPNTFAMTSAVASASDMISTATLSPRVFVNKLFSSPFTRSPRSPNCGKKSQSTAVKLGYFGQFAVKHVAYLVTVIEKNTVLIHDLEDFGLVSSIIID